MIYSYFPGCTLKNKATELDDCARLSAKALGITLCELPEWQCCGGVYPMSKDEIAPKLSSVRALIAARDAGHDLVTLCSACHNVIKQVNNDLRTDAEMRFSVQKYIGTDYSGETNVVHYLEMLRDTVGFDKLRQLVVKPFTGVKIGAYYGCLLLRPSKVMAMDDPENPSIIEDFIRAVGGEPVVYAMRNECCGGYITLEDRPFALKRANKVIKNAERSGADLIITACPLCLYNLTRNASSELPVKYFTEILAEALGITEAGNAE